MRTDATWGSRGYRPSGAPPPPAIPWARGGRCRFRIRPPPARRDGRAKVRAFRTRPTRSAEKRMHREINLRSCISERRRAVSTLNEDGSATWRRSVGLVAGLQRDARFRQAPAHAAEPAAHGRVRAEPARRLAAPRRGPAQRWDDGFGPRPAAQGRDGLPARARQFAVAGLTPEPSASVAAPRVRECPVQLEATLAAAHPLAHAIEEDRDKLLAIEVTIRRVHVHESIPWPGTSTASIPIAGGRS